MLHSFVRQVNEPLDDPMASSIEPCPHGFVRVARRHASCGKLTDHEMFLVVCARAAADGEVQARRPIGKIEAQLEVGPGRWREKSFVTGIPAEVRKYTTDVFEPTPSLTFGDVVNVSHLILDWVDIAQIVLVNKA